MIIPFLHLLFVPAELLSDLTLNLFAKVVSRPLHNPPQQAEWTALRDVPTQHLRYIFDIQFGLLMVDEADK